MSYPKRRNGDEYYPGGDAKFLKNERGDEVYARDRKGNELYPRTKRLVLIAKDRFGREYYARDKAGNQIYPLWRRRSVPIRRDDPVAAVTKEGSQRYLVDDRGNEFYWKRGDEPVVLKNESGDEYLARTRNGREMIPWNYLSRVTPEEHPLMSARDVNGNLVYFKRSDVSRGVEGLFRCMCELLLVLPVTLSIITML